MDMYGYVCVCVYMYVYVCICMYMYMYVCLQVTVVNCFRLKHQNRLAGTDDTPDTSIQVWDTFDFQSQPKKPGV